MKTRNVIVGSMFGLVALLLTSMLFVSQAVAAQAFTAADVAQHSTGTDCWLIIDGKVYDVTPYIPFHPGGRNEIVSLCGTDATSAFGGVGHSSGAQNLLQNYYVGDLAVPDVVPPVIVLLGQNPASVSIGAVYADAGATATDNVDGPITSAIATSGLPISTAAVGTFYVTYSVNDSSGNTASAARTVNVVRDTVLPVMTVSGPSQVSIPLGSSYSDAGATATDNIDGTIAVTTTFASPSGASEPAVDTSVAGVHIVTYTATDSSGNTATATRPVNVLAPAPEPTPDAVPPAITVRGTALVNIQEGSVYTDAGATATDNVDGNLTAAIAVTNSVNTRVPGTYVVTYSVSDAAGNVAYALRTVNVLAVVVPPANETSPPVNQTPPAIPPPVEDDDEDNEEEDGENDDVEEDDGDEEDDDDNGSHRIGGRERRGDGDSKVRRRSDESRRFSRRESDD